MYDPADGIPDQHARKWAMFCHLGGLAWFTCIPMGWIILPWVLWLMSRQDHPYIDQQGREAINFQLSITIYNIAIAAMMAVLSLVLLGWLLAPLVAIIALAEIAGCVIAAYKTSQGEPFHYPLTIRFLS